MAKARATQPKKAHKTIEKGASVRGPVRRPKEVMARMLEAATVAFTKDGFKGARMRSIAADAGITIQLLIYHAKTKDNLWHMVMKHILSQYSKFDSRIKGLPQNSSAADQLRLMIADIVHFTASVPDVHRMMTQEGAQMTPRLVWMIENFIRPQYEEFTRIATAAEREGAVRSDIDVHRLRYAVTAIAAVPFSVAAEYEYLTGKNPFSRGEIAKTIELIEHMVFVA